MYLRPPELSGGRQVYGQVLPPTLCGTAEFETLSAFYVVLPEFDFN